MKNMKILVGAVILVLVIAITYKIGYGDGYDHGSVNGRAYGAQSVCSVIQIGVLEEQVAPEVYENTPCEMKP